MIDAEIISIATPAERAWEALRVAIRRRDADPNPATFGEVRRLGKAFRQALDRSGADEGAAA
jgi:hypothetical protein